MNKDDNKIGYWGAVSIGVGGMVGGGIFAVLGLAVQLAHGGTPVAFFIAGLVALVTCYSYSKLSLAFPSQGGTVVFLDKAFGVDLFTGSMNNLLWLSYIIMLALYSYAFGSYGSTFFSGTHHALAKHVLISLGIIFPALLNFLSAKFIGKAETYIVVIKITILLFFIAVGLRGIDMHRLAFANWSGSLQLVSGGMIIFLAYEGFELIANAAGDMASPAKTLKKAYFSAVVFVIILYILVAIVAIGNLPVDQIVHAKDYALAAAAKPFLGQAGFTLIAIAALLSTFSAINATLYGAARLSYTIAKEGELPSFLEDKVWNKPLEGLIITSVLALLLANVGDLSSISMMGSAGFLLIFASVNLANIRLSGQTNSRVWISVTGTIACIAAFVALVYQTATNHPTHLWILVGLTILAFSIEVSWSYYKNRKFRLH